MISKRQVKYYCKNYTEIENYAEAMTDETEMWTCHHRMEEVFTYQELKRAGWYYNRKASELIFIKQSEHNGNPELHIGCRRNYEAKKGKTSWNKGVSHSEETKRKMSEAKKDRHWKLVDGKRVWY